LINRIQAAQDDLHRLYEEVRDYAAPIIVRTSTCSLGKLLYEAWCDLTPLWADRQVELHQHSAQVDLSCETSKSGMLRVFRNIFENALAASQDPARVDVRFRDTLLSGRPALEIAVRDNGSGLTADQRENIFRPF